MVAPASAAVRMPSAERLDERRGIVDPLVLHEADPHGCRLGLLDAGEGLRDAIGLEELHSRKYAPTGAHGPGGPAPP